MIDNLRAFLKPQVGYLAKSSGEQLWVHHYTVYKVCMRILELLPAFPEDLVNPLQLACLTHDLGKMRPQAQKVLRGAVSTSRVVHKPAYDEIEAYIEKARGLRRPASKKEIKAAYDMAVTHHSVTDEDVIRNSTAYSASGVLLLRVSDWLASMEEIDPDTLERLNTMFLIPGSPHPLLYFTYFEVGREPGPSTSIIASEALAAFEELGYRRLVLFPNAAIVAKAGGVEYPTKEIIARRAYERISRDSLVNIKPNYGTKNLLIGACAEMPHSYLTVHSNQILEDLSKADLRAPAFFKLYAEILSLLGYGPGGRENPWALNVVHGLTTGVSGIPKAGREWEKKTGIELPKQDNGKLNRLESLNTLFGHLTLSQLLPGKVLDALDKEQKQLISPYVDKTLSKMKQKELFGVLLALAENVNGGDSQKEKRLQEIATLVSFPVEADFAQIAAERFQAYKRYKKNPDPDKGVCEMCGSAFTQKPGTEAPAGAIQCFSYIKAHPKKPRAVCHLCAYDIALIRNEVRPNNHSITMWITSRVDLEMGARLEEAIKRINSSLNNPRSLSKMMPLSENFNLPLPEHFKLPLTKNAADLEKDLETPTKFLHTPFGLFGYLGQVAGKGFSVKNQRAVYAALYDILRLIGFNVCLTNDLEFRYGLFGEQRISTKESFFDAVSIMLLSKTFPREKKNQYCIAADIIANQPSLAISRAVETDENNRPLLTEEQLKFYFQALMRSDRPLLKGGEITMGELLRDAAFFARNINRFCVEPEEKGEFWQNLTKHKATKPVMAALNAMMRGHDFDVAISAFMAQLSNKIAKEDRRELDDFVRRSKEIFERYYQLRQSSFSDFLKAKNALMNAIFAFTRYKDLDSVLVEG
ncbi:MAG: hypothetical protein QME84_09450 [Actinomycetota bacterium]|nr:hypothetical protein [Actinomycetota bacterium]